MVMFLIQSKDGCMRINTFIFFKMYYMKYLKQFVIGTSVLVVWQFLYAVHNLGKKKTYSYYHYSIIAPLWFGLWNVISLLLAEKFNLSSRARFLLITPITFLISILIVKTIGAYNYSQSEWVQYYIRLFIRHFITWNIIIFYLEKYI